MTNFTTEKQMQKICPLLCTSRINENNDVELAQVNCQGDSCAMWTAINENFGMCSITASNEAIIHEQMNKMKAEKNG
ncbi:hypothetical protein [Candidatus Uabimicrobium sp. HlEnr_7]|uniref:hypothetical protein n=1 Tax=Candidatus Uabimicrobium helgolandensis TaxID=3095367 RepID=UPI003555EC9C